jgi:hypothetical protein
MIASEIYLEHCGGTILLAAAVCKSFVWQPERLSFCRQLSASDRVNFTADAEVERIGRLGSAPT